LEEAGALVLGADAADRGSVDTVVVGFHEDFDYWRLTAAVQAVLAGARLIGTNDDLIFPTHDGLRPGAGPLLAAVQVATGVEAELAGKPYGPMCDVVRSRVEGLDGLCVMVGDRPDTDGRFARALGWRWSLVLSGLISEADLPVDPEPDTVHADLLGAVRDHLGS